MIHKIDSTCRKSLRKSLQAILLLLSIFLLNACGNKTNYDDALEFNEGLAAVKTNGFYCYIDPSLNAVIKPEYYQAHSFHNGIAFVKKASNWGAINKKNEVIIPFKYTQLGTFSKDLAVVNKYSKLGCLDYTGNVIIDFKYDKIELYTYYKETNETFSSESTFILDDTYKNLVPYNFALTYLDDKVGFIDLQTLFTLEPKYSSISISPTDSTILSIAADTPSGDMYGFADLSNKTIVEPKFYYPLEFSEGLAAARDPDLSKSHLQLYGFIDKTGEYVIEPTYSYAGKFGNGLAPVEDFIETSLMGYINTSNEYIIPPAFDKALPFQNGSAIVQAFGKYTMINTSGAYLTNDYFYDIQFPASNFITNPDIGCALYKSENGNYYTSAINRSGDTLFYTNYDYMGAFQEDICIVGKDNKYGCINTKGIEVIPLIYDGITTTKLQNIFIAVSNKKAGVITIENEELLPCNYDSIEVKNNNNLLLLKDNKYGVYNLQTKKIIEPLYDEILFSLDSDILSVRENKEWFFIDADGNKLK